MSPTFFNLLAAIGLALIHLFAGKLRLLDVLPRSRWLSFAGGVSIAYALLYLLPELDRHQEAVAETGDGPATESAVYLLTLVGLLVFYGLEKVAQGPAGRKRDDRDGTGIFWIHVGSFAAYNALIGYILATEERGLASLAFFFVALGLHFLVNDHGLRQHHRQRYRRVGRWMISAAIIGGWIVGTAAPLPDAVTASIFGLVTGGILLNTFKEELPKERESRFWAFGLGAALGAALLIFV